VDGIDTRTPDGVHLTMAGVTKVVDPWLLPVVERLGSRFAKNAPTTTGRVIPPRLRPKSVSWDRDLRRE